MVRRLHDADQPVGAKLARALIETQMPELAHLPMKRLAGGGTDNVLYRVGRAHLARFPRRAWAEAEIDKLVVWLPRLAPALPLAVPQVELQGRPDMGYPFRWTLGNFLTGQDAYTAPPEDQVKAAETLARCLRRLHAAPAPAKAPRRGAADRIDLILAGLEPFVAEFAGEADPAVLRHLIARARQAPPQAGRLAWVHGDLHPLNLLTRRGKLVAVLDWGGMGLGDPAMDLMPAWTLFDAPAREVVRRALHPDPGAWARGRALALAKAVMAIPYYRHSNPVFYAVMCRTLERVISDPWE